MRKKIMFVGASLKRKESIDYNNNPNNAISFMPAIGYVRGRG